MNVHSLTSKSAVNTCLANSFWIRKYIFQPTSALASAEDVLIVFSGSGNSQYYQAIMANTLE